MVGVTIEPFVIEPTWINIGQARVTRHNRTPYNSSKKGEGTMVHPRVSTPSIKIGPLGML